MSILDDIRNRTAPKAVPERKDVFQEQQTSLASQENTIESDRAERNEGNNQADANFESNPELSSISDLEQLRLKLSQFPEIASRVPVRLEINIKEDIEAFCRREKITIETLLEALYLTCTSKDTVMRQVTKEAKRRLASRKAAGNIRSSITRLENIKNI